jgi:exonuclease III
MRFGTWNVRSMYRSGSLRIVGKEISKYKLDLVGVQEVRWDGSGTKMDLREIGWDGVEWIGLIWLRIGTSGGPL